MPISDAKSFKTSDGRLFEDLPAAKDHEFTTQFYDWWVNRGLNAYTSVYNIMLEDRHKLLAIFRELNGGSTIAGITAPRKDPMITRADLLTELEHRATNMEDAATMLEKHYSYEIHRVASGLRSAANNTRALVVKARQSDTGER